MDNVDSCQWVAIIFEHAFGAGTVATALDLIEAGYAMLAHESFETQTHPELLAVQSRLEAVSWKQPACDVRSHPSSDSADAQLATLRCRCTVDRR